MSQLSIMGTDGHTTLAWDPSDEESVQAARETFERLLGEGFQAFAVSSGRGHEAVKGDRKITEFDPSLEEVIMVPKVAGG